MPKITVEINYDYPVDPYWLNPDNVKFCLEKTCSNTHFAVHWAENGDPWRPTPCTTLPLVSVRQGRMLRLK
jgi:hypothetical protein